MAIVYLSSTYSDLKDCRERVYHALRQLGHDVHAMEDYVASDKRPLQKCLEDIRRSDIYVGVIAWRYGFIPLEDNPDKKSITELEFRYASQCKIPTLLFLLKDDAKWPRSSMDVGEESKHIEALRSDLTSSKTVSFFEDSENLATLVSTAVTNTVRELEEERAHPTLTALNGWLEKHLNRTENEFISHISGVDRLTEAQAAGRYVELLVEKVAKPNQQKEPAQPLSEYSARRGTRLVVLGEGGSGKTTSLLKLAFDAARRARSERGAAIPIYAKLNFFDTSEKGFDELVRILTVSTGLDAGQVLALWRDESRSIVFLLDGFNEIRNEFQSGCALAIEALMQRQHSFVITSRPTGGIRHLIERSLQIDELNVVQLNDGQIEDFLMRHGASSLYQQMSSELKGLGRNPFLLWALAQSCAGLTKAELPKNQGQLYRNLIDAYLFETHEQRKNPSPTEYNYQLVKKPLLATLAMTMTQEGVTRKAQDIDLLRDVRKQLTEIRGEYEGVIAVRPYELMPDPPSAKGILDEVVVNGVLRRVGQTIEFMHESVQDYFTAVQMLDWTESKILSLAPAVSFNDSIQRDKGFEAVVMLAGLKDDSSELLRALTGHNPLLAAHCFRASSAVARAVRAQLLDHWRTMLHQQNREYRKLACMCLGTARIDSEELLRELVKVAVLDEDYAVRNAAKESVIQIKPLYALSYGVDLGLNEPYEDEALTDLSELLFGIDLPAAVTSLFDKWRRAEVGGEKRRRAEILLTPRSWEESAVAKQLSRIRLDAIQREDIETSRAAQEVLNLLVDWQKAHTKEIRIPHASEMRRRVEEMQNLAQSVPGVPTATLIEILKQENYVAGYAAKEIAVRGAKEGIEPLVEALYRQHIRGNIDPIVDALVTIDRTRAVQLLRGAREGPDSGKQTRAAVALGLMGDFEGIAYVRKALSVENSAFRGAAAQALGSLGDDGAIAALADGVRSESDKDVILEMLRALGYVKAANAAKALLEFLLGRVLYRHHETDELKQAARRGLLQAADPQEVISWLHEAVQSKDVFRRAKGVEELSGLEDRSSELMDVLRIAYKDPEGSVRAAALAGLAARTKATGDLQELWAEALKDHDASVRGRALDLWASAEPAGAQDALLESALSDADWYVRDVAAVKLRSQLLPTIGKLSQIMEEGEITREIAAIKTLGMMGENMVLSGVSGDVLKEDGKEKVLAALSPALAHADPHVRLEAVRAMRSVEYSESEGLVQPVLVDVAWHGESVEVRQEAAELLTHMGSGRTALFKPILDRLDNPEEYVELIKLIGEDQPFLPKDGRLYALRGSIHQTLKRFDKAQGDYENALKLGYDRVWMRNSWANNFAELGHYEEACDVLRKAIEAEPGDAEAHANLGWYAYQAGQYGESIEESKIAVALDSTLVNAAFNLGIAYLANHQMEKARQAYEQAIEACKTGTEENIKEYVAGALKDIDELLVTRPEVAADVSELKTKLSSILTGKSDDPN